MRGETSNWPFVTLVVLALAGSAGADQIYHWVDSSGRVHFSNAPAVDSHASDVGTDEIRMQTTAPPPAAAGTPAATGAAESAADRVHDLRAAQRRLEDIDAQLATLAKARTAHAGGTPGTGGLGTNAAEYLSPEEEKLKGERGEVEQQINELRGTASASAAAPGAAAPVKPAGSP
jgi:hypothetical protein